MRFPIIVCVSLALTITPALAAKKKSPKSSETTDFSAGQDAVTHTPARNQGHVGFCWAYTLAGFMEGEAKKENINVTLSPEYLGFYHMYFQLQKHLSWFDSQSHRLKQNDMDDAVNDAYQRIYVQNHFFQPTEGNDEKIALQELEISGAVPQDAFDFKLGSGTKETDFENSIKSFIKNNMFSGKALATYKAVDSNGINQNLFESFSKALDIHPPQPTGSFSVGGKSYTPTSFVSDYLKFEPSAYTELDVSRGNEQAALNLVRDIMKKNIAVPIGFQVFDDPNSDTNAQKSAEEAGDFSTRFCPGGKCSQVAGGHEVLGVNWTEDSSGNVSSIIIKNSWGHTGGRTDRGVKSREAADTGFYVLEDSYLAESNPSWLIIVPKEFARNLK